MIADECEDWMKSCWVCRVAILSFGEIGAWYGHKKRTWCKPCWRRKMETIQLGHVVAQQVTPSLNRFAVGSFGDMVGDLADKNDEGHEFFVCPPQSLDVFHDDQEGLMDFNDRGRALEGAGLVEAIPGTNPVRHRLTARARALVDSTKEAP